MNYSGNMPDWHQYNATQTSEVTPSTQNVNSGHLGFIPGVNPPTLNPINLNTESHNKHQTDANFNPRNYQSFNNVTGGPNIPNNGPLASMVQMQNCIGHYGSQNTRNPMLDNINTSVDPRNTSVGAINDEIGYRSNQLSFNGSIGHLSGPGCNLNASSAPGTGSGITSGPRVNPGSSIGNNSGNGAGPGSMFGPGSIHGPVPGLGSTPGHGPNSGLGNMGPRNTNVGSVPSSGKPAPPPSYMPCKGLCCNQDPNVNYQQWDKYGSYQNNTSYRENVHPPSYQMDNRHYGNNCNYRKDNLEGKEIMGSALPNASGVDHRRNFTDYKYHKDHLAARNYSTSSGMYHNYPMQSYNYSAEHQKYAYPTKEHTKPNNMNMANNPGLLKHQDQNFLTQQKFGNKQFQYQNGSMLPKGIPTLNVNANMPSSPQNLYFNSQFPRTIPADMPHECQESADNNPMVNRMQNSFMHSSSSQHQMYQHKIAMQKLTMENHLRELSRIPGYQSHPKYKECVLRYREVLKLQQTAGYQSPMQQTARVATPTNTGVAPINLQFDQNGMLINSTYMPDSFQKLQPSPSIEQLGDTIDKQNKEQTVAIGAEKYQQSEQLMIRKQNKQVPSPCVEPFHKQNQFSIHKDFNQNQLKVQTSENHSFDTLNTDTNNEALMQQKASKEFANKPDLDVRQFLANWDETDDEEGAGTTLPETVLSETTPVVVVSYENVDLSSKTVQPAETSRRPSFCANETLEATKEDGANVISAQDCLTISYASLDNAEISKTTKRTIGEGVVKPGSIIHCISNGPDEIPTIHIVDNLEISNILGASNDQVIQTLEKHKAVSFFRETGNNRAEDMPLENTEQEKDGTHILSAHYGTSLDNTSKGNNMEASNISETIQATTVLTATGKNNLDGADNMELKKQHSFEESHNPDDISLPDLPTSECTPISTTLNTPIHSDTEESSQNIEDISISTNPIEVMQNSPVISFTQLNSEDNVENRSLSNMALEYPKEHSNHSKFNHEQDVSVSNFDFSSGQKRKSTEMSKNKQVPILSTNTAKKKVYQTDGKEDDHSLVSVENELDHRQEETKNNRNLEHRPQSTVCERRKSVGSKVNFTLTESDDELHNSKNERALFRKRRRKNLTVTTNTNHEMDLTSGSKIKEATTWEDKCIDKYLAQRKDANHLRQSKNPDSSSSKDGKHSVRHVTSQYKHYSIAVIKDNFNLSDKRSQGTTGSSRIHYSNTEESSEESEIKKQVSSKAVTTLQETIQSETSKLLQKDLKTVDGDVRYTAEEIHLLKEYRKKKGKLQKNEFKSRNHETIKPAGMVLQKMKSGNSFHHRNKLECSQDERANEVAAHKVCFDQNPVSSVVCSDSENQRTHEEPRGHMYPENLVKDTDYGIQVANVNLEIKDSDVGKELILGEKKRERKEGIKIEINVSCRERTSKGQEQKKRLLYDDRSLYETDVSPSYSVTLDSQRRLYYENQEDGPVVADKSDVAIDSKNDTEVNLSAMLKRCGRTLLDSTEETRSINPKETCNLFNKAPSNNISPRSMDKSEAIESTDLFTDHADTVKSKSAISNTAIVDGNNKVKVAGEEDLTQEQGSTSINEEVGSGSSSKIPKKILGSKLVELSTKSLDSLKNFDFSFTKLEYKRNSKLNAEKGNRVDDQLEEGSHASKWKKPKIDIFQDCNMFQSSSGYVNPIFSCIDKLEDLHTVPVYTTKDGRISYSPNRRFTYHELMMEARRREPCSSGRKSHTVDTWNSYYNSGFRKLYKKKRHCGLSDRQKNEYKDTKYLYDRKRSYHEEFYNKSHLKYKDYVPKFRNNNDAWPDHCNKMYSSSDSDEEIVDQSKSRSSEVSILKNSPIVENKIGAVSKSNRDDIVTDKLILQAKNGGKEVTDNNLNDGNSPSQGETPSIQSEIVEIIKENADVKSGINDCEDRPDSNAEADTAHVDNEKETSEQSENESSTQTNLKIVSENLHIEGKCVTENEKGDESNEDKLCKETERENNGNDEKFTSEETKVIEDQVKRNTNVSDNLNSFLIIENGSGNIEQTETSNNSNTVKELVLETEEIVQVSKPTGNFVNDVDQILQEPSEPEISNDVSADLNVEFVNASISDTKNLDFEGDIQGSGKIEVPKEDNSKEEVAEEKGENDYTLNYKNDSSSIDEILLRKDVEVPECPIVPPDETCNEKNDSEEISFHTVEHTENENKSAVEVDDLSLEEESFSGFPNEEILNNENDIICNKDKLVDYLPHVEETTTGLQLMAGNLMIETSIDNLPNNAVTEREINRSQESVPNTSCVIKRSANRKSEMTEKGVENMDEQGEEQSNSLKQVHDKSLNITTDLKTIPKLVIKKTDGLNSKLECSQDCTDSSTENKYDAKLLSEARPKIPKMIIMKNRSRSVTPTVEILEKSKYSLPEQNDVSMDMDNSDSELYTLKYNDYENKVPKVKIKLEDISSKDLKLYLKRKAAKKHVRKIKIKKYKTQENIKHETEDSSGTDTSDSEEDNNYQKSMISDTEVDRVPKIKLKKQEEISPDRNRGKDWNNSKVASKENRRTKEEDSKLSAKYNSTNNISDELKKKFPQCIIEKIPKVIIKRTQIGAEFKCEISKRKKTTTAETSKWQPKVKLQRLQLLDHMVKDLKPSTIISEDSANSPTHAKNDINDTENEDSTHNGKVKLCRSISASSLSPIKSKQRRLSDIDYVKLNAVASTEFQNNLEGHRVIDSGAKNFKKNVAKKLFCENDPEECNQSDESENETMKNSFRNILLNEDSDSMVMRKEYSLFGNNEDTPIIEDKFLNSVARSRNYSGNDNSIIKVDSSDESQTTIEILPASPHSSDDEEKNSEFENSSEINTGGAIPTQLELELELIDNSNLYSGMIASSNTYASHSKNKCSNEGSARTYFSEFQCSSRNTLNESEYNSFEKRSQSSEKQSNDYFYCNDLLVKEVLAAKEALKKCLSRTENEGIKSKLRTAAEKKQGSTLSVRDHEKPLDTSGKQHSTNDNDKRTVHKKTGNLEKKRDGGGRCLKEEVYSTECPTASTFRENSVPEQTTISLKASKKFGQASVNTGTNTFNMSDRNNREESQGEKLDKEIKNTGEDRKANDNSNETRRKEDNMPLLVPEFVLNFESSSDTDISRSPPIITNQEEIEQMAEDAKIIDDKVISQTEEAEENKKHSYKDCKMTIADIITELAYHEKATIKHKRYCNLCERWFPTTSRHRRHLAGYQHRYMELTQRKSIHALFILFTGKPCPRLLPANVIRSDCSIGELTPLQIAVQDIAKCVEYTQQNLKTKE